MATYSTAIPATDPKQPSTLAKDFQYFHMLQANRINWDWMWQRIADYTIPIRGDYVVTRFPGQRRDQDIYDTTATWANEQLSAGLHTLLTTQALPWFFLGTRESEVQNNQEVQIWLADTQARIYQIFNDPGSHFQAQIHEQYLDLGAFGTGILDVQYDKGVKFHNRFLGECYMAQTHWGVIDTMFRAFALPFHRILQVFGEENLPQKFVQDHKDPFSMHMVLHVCVPEDAKWASRYYLINERALIKEGSFKQFPYITPRWSHSNVEHYGRGPAIACFADILMVNEMKRTMLRAAHMAVDPPLLVPDGGGFMQPIMLQPRAINYYDTSIPGEIRYLKSENNFQIGEKMMQDVQDAIVRAFYVDMLQLPGGMMPGAKNQNTYMTATEATIRRENAMRVMGPITSRLQGEMLGPLITKVYSILLQQRSLEPFPQVAKTANVEIAYVSPLSIAQAGAEVDNWTRFMAQVQPLAAIDPTVLDSINMQEVAPYLAGRYHLAPRLILTSQQVAAKVKAREQAQQQQQQAQTQQIQQDANLKNAKYNTERSKQMDAMSGAPAQ